MTKRSSATETTIAAPRLRRVSVVGAALLAVMLGGCATGNIVGSAFVDPSKYDLYDCKQLITARDGANARANELEALIAKAETGAAGTLVSGLAYQSDYAAARAQRDLIDQKLASNDCAAELAPPPLAASPAKAKRKKTR